MTFDAAIEHVLSAEGGYVFNKNDSGGETNWGISKRSYPKLNIRDLTRSEAIEIYRRDFWNAVKADQLPARIRLHVFDFAVNAGVKTATKLLQSLSGVKKDGDIGSITLRHAKNLSAWEFSNGRIRHYSGLVRDRPKDIIFLTGWMLRNNEVTRLCLAGPGDD